MSASKLDSRLAAFPPAAMCFKRRYNEAPMNTSFINRSILITGLLLSSTMLIAQSVGLYGGYSHNHLFDFGKDGHIESEYLINSSYTIGIGIENVKIDWLNMSFTVDYHTYGGEIQEKYSGLASWSTTNVQITKSSISVGIFPINLYLFNHIELDFGVLFSGLIQEDFNGTKMGCSGNVNGGFDCFTINLEEKYQNISARWVFGIQAKVGYDFHLSETLILAPSYSLSLGLSDEFSEVILDKRFMRHNICLGVKKKIGE